MPQATYTPLATVTLASSASSVSFSNIPATPYRDLIVVTNQLGTIDQDTNSYFRFNGDTGSNYSRIYAFGVGSGSGVSGSDSGTTLPVLNARTQVGVNISQIMDYSATDKHKTVLTRNDQAGYVSWMSAGRWASTAAINTILIHPFGGNWAAGATFNLYGVIA